MAEEQKVEMKKEGGGVWTKAFMQGYREGRVEVNNLQAQLKFKQDELNVTIADVIEAQMLANDWAKENAALREEMKDYHLLEAAHAEVQKELGKKSRALDIAEFEISERDMDLSLMEDRIEKQDNDIRYLKVAHSEVEDMAIKHAEKIQELKEEALLAERDMIEAKEAKDLYWITKLKSRDSKIEEMKAAYDQLWRKVYGSEPFPAPPGAPAKKRFLEEDSEPRAITEDLTEDA